MTSPTGIKIPIELAYTRRSAFAVELVDALTMERVSEGITAKAIGIRRQAIRNQLGLFVWPEQDLASLTKVSIETGATPYERTDLTPDQLRLPNSLTIVPLAPAVSYSFARGVTGVRGTVLEDRQSLAPVANAKVYLRWLDHNGEWQDAPIRSHTTRNGDFVSVLRLASNEEPNVDGGAVTVRLHVSREGMGARESADVKLPQGRIADSTKMPALTFAWDELQP